MTLSNIFAESVAMSSVPQPPELQFASESRPQRLLMKIACGMSNLPQTHQDFADVVELISIRNLDGSFARFLHKSLRPTYRELVRNAQACEDD